MGRCSPASLDELNDINISGFKTSYYMAGWKQQQRQQQTSNGLNAIAGSTSVTCDATTRTNYISSNIA